MTSISKIRHRERRWIVLGEDGRHVTIGRHSDPADSEIANLEQSLGDQGLNGWLVIVDGQTATEADTAPVHATMQALEVQTP